MLGLSEKGVGFSSSGDEGDDGLIHTYSELASEDFIYDCQDNWNLNFQLGQLMPFEVTFKTKNGGS